MMLGVSQRSAPPSSPHATATMRANRGRDTAPEVAIRSLLHRSGVRFRKDVRIDLPDGRVRPDVVFARQRVAVFVDGCFWHGCPEHAEWPASNADFWREKIEGNRARDKRQDVWLTAAGWDVIRIWEHEPPETAVQRVLSTLRDR